MQSHYHFIATQQQFFVIKYLEIILLYRLGNIFSSFSQYSKYEKGILSLNLSHANIHKTDNLIPSAYVRAQYRSIPLSESLQAHRRNT